MKSNENQLPIIPIAKGLARVSLVGGTLVFLAGSLIKTDWTLVTGAVFLWVTFIVNSLALFVLSLCFLARPKHRKQLLQTALVMLFNIPVAILYAWLILQSADPNL
jgi:predicted membrane channel-forming protein YqfA (hemolysin III family)